MGIKGLNALLVDLREEIRFAVFKFGDFKSAHEGYAVILEEVDELWDEIKKRQAARDLEQIRIETLHVAAMAIKLALFIGGK